MRTIRFALAVVVGLCLSLIMAANMAEVDLHLLPPQLGAEVINLKGVPLALVIVCSVLVGILLGLLIEFFRESKHREKLAERRREIGRLRAENAQLARQLGMDAAELSGSPG